MPMTQNS